MPSTEIPQNTEYLLVLLVLKANGKQLQIYVVRTLNTQPLGIKV